MKKRNFDKIYRDVGTPKCEEDYHARLARNEASWRKDYHANGL